MTTPLITIQSLTKRYTPRAEPVLDGIDLAVAPGAFQILLGPSGCGKSTLLNIVAGLLDATSGTVTLNGQAIAGPGKDRGVVFQNADTAIFPWLTVAQNVAYGPKMNGLPAAEIATRVTHYLDLVGLAAHRDKYPSELSGGMKQRTQIARVLANEPELLIMDEPFSALDAQTRLVMQQELIKIWQATGKTIIFVTHDIQEAILLGTDIAILTKAPHAHVEAVHQVALPYPRLVTDPAVAEWYAQISQYFFTPPLHAVERQEVSA